jgi:hypothetical protein
VGAPDREWIVIVDRFERQCGWHDSTSNGRIGKYEPDQDGDSTVR